MANKHKNHKPGEDTKHRGAPAPNENQKAGPEQTHMPQEQDPKRRFGRFEGEGEAPFRQPGERQ